MQIIFNSVEIHHIDLSDTTFKISTEIPIDDLIASIGNIGLISPPTLKQTAEDKYIVVSGFRRVEACCSLGWQYVDARIIIESESNLEPLKLAIADNALNRQLNVIEQAVSVSKLSAFYPDHVELSSESQSIGLNVNPGLIKKLKKIDTVDIELKNKVAADIVPFSIGLELGDMEQTAATAFAQIIEKLHPTLNHQKEIIRLVKEVSRLKGAPILDVINDRIVNDAINDPDLDRKQKIQIIRQHLKQVRYPEIVCFESNYQACLRRMKLPESIFLNPPADFEGNNFSMVLHFQNLNQFKTVSDLLNQLQNHPDFAKILEKEFEDN